MWHDLRWATPYEISPCNKQQCHRRCWVIIHPLISSHVYIYFHYSHSRSIYTYETCQAYQTAHYSWIMMFIYDAVSAFINVCCSIRENAKAYKYTEKVLGCISRRAKLCIPLRIIAVKIFHDNFGSMGIQVYLFLH